MNEGVRRNAANTLEGLPTFVYYKRIPEITILFKLRFGKGFCQFEQPRKYTQINSDILMMMMTEPPLPTAISTAHSR